LLLLLWQQTAADAKAGHWRESSEQERGEYQPYAVCIPLAG